MKKTLALILLLVLVLTCALGALVACQPQEEPDPDKKPDDNKDPDTPYVADNTEHYDVITKTLKLEKSYAGKSFISDGVGGAKVTSYTDGDTTNFLLADGKTSVTIRYYSVNTPESTGNVEKWGKAASLFVEKQLSKATEIVLEATADQAEHDNYGVRYLGYVWYKTEDYGEFKCLNLELVENGYSHNKGVDTRAFPYNAKFVEAERFAESIKLRLHSELDDPNYSDKPVEMTIKDFWENTDAYYNSDTKIGSKVKFTAYLSSLRISGTGTYTFIATQYDPETGKKYDINVYTAYNNSSASSSFELGQLYEIIGDIQNYYGTFQISGINAIEGATNATEKVQEGYYLTFDASTEWRRQYRKTLYTDVTVTESSVKDGVITVVGTAQLRKTNSSLGETETFTFTVPAPSNYNNQLSVGSTFSVRGFQFEERSGKITILNYSDITIK